jgi:hypothetical protein
MMKDHYVDAQNRMLSVLGYVCGGTKQRFLWMWSEDIPYWAGRMRPRWVLCQWQRPKVLEQMWVADFPGIPYPANGMYHAKTETAIRPGEKPSVSLTENFVFALDHQMSKSPDREDRDVLDAVVKIRDEEYREWVEFVQDTAPAFENYDWGSRAGSVSFGGT